MRNQFPRILEEENMDTSGWFSTQNNMHFSVDKYKQPTHPGDLNISANNTYIMDITMRDNHKEDTAIFRQIVDV